ncbi:HU family DNA-binding protein [Desulfocurvus vexinensis]|uniref:HU family DNA-binding protein n=1 Tax=Desulfocurvus vexinensis TaxID=399548 RepID=UPI00048B5F29|nr:HU family DNA-binding protein [Desulfocurvus vexinensis]
MNKTELIAAVTKGNSYRGMTNEEILTSTFAVITQELQRGGEVMLTGFGKFSVATRPARQGRNPKTGEPISIPASRTVRFAPAKGLKGAVNG